MNHSVDRRRYRRFEGAEWPTKEGLKEAFVFVVLIGVVTLLVYSCGAALGGF